METRTVWSRGGSSDRDRGGSGPSRTESAQVQWAASAVAATLLTVSLAGCGDDNEDGGRSASGEGCVTDVSGSPTGTYVVADVDPTSTRVFLTSGAAIVQTGDGEPEPVAIGGPGPLQDALNGKRVWAALGSGFVLDTSASNDDGAPLEIIDEQGETVATGPAVGQVDEVRVLGDQFVAVEASGSVKTVSVESGAEVDPHVEDPGKYTMSPVFASWVAVVEEGTYGAAVDVESGDKVRFDDLLDLGVEDNIGTSGAGIDKVVLRNQEGDRTSRVWFAKPGEEPTDVYSSDDEALYDGDVWMGSCDDYLYIVEFGELKVIDTGNDDEVVSRRALTIAEDQTVAVHAVPGGVLTVVSDGQGAANFQWFNG